MYLFALLRGFVLVTGDIELHQLSTLLATEKQQLERVDPSLKCHLCHDSLICMLFLECAHRVACQRCTQGLRHCPVCQQRIVRVVKTIEI